MIAAIDRACRLLSAPSATPIEVARGLGSIVEGAAGDHEIVTRPSDPSVSTATVVARIDSPEADVVVLDPAPGTTLTVADLVAAYGRYREGPRTRPASPRRLVFRPAIRGPGHTCVVVADARPENDDLAHAPVERVTVRRELVP